MNTTQTTLALAATAAILAFNATSMAGITSIGEFTGDVTENFENIIPPGPHAGPMPIFGGDATLNDALTNSPWIANSLFGGGGETLFPYQGNLMALAPTGWTEINFNTPVMQFGGFFGAGGDTLGGNATFLDETGAVIEVVAWESASWQWEWHGWQSDTPIASVILHTGQNPGITTVYDALQASYTIPAPGAAALLFLAGGLTRRRRR